MYRLLRQSRKSELFLVRSYRIALLRVHFTNIELKSSIFCRIRTNCAFSSSWVLVPVQQFPSTTNAFWVWEQLNESVYSCFALFVHVNTALQGVYRRLAVQLTETFDKHSAACCVSSWWVVGRFVWVSRLQQVVFAVSSAQTRRFQLSGCHETRVEPSTLFTHKEIHTEPQMHNLSLSCSDLVRC